MSSVDVGDDSVGHSAAVLLPGRSVLRSALSLVSRLPVHQQHAEVQHVEVRQDVGEPCGGTAGSYRETVSVFKTVTINHQNVCVLITLTLCRTFSNKELN